MRIAIATDFYTPWIGGPATFIENLCAYLAGTSHHVEVIAPSHTGRPGIERRDGLIIHRLPTVPLPVGHNLRAGIHPGAARAALLAARPDVVQLHHPFPICAAVSRAALRERIPVVAINHTIPECSLYGLRRIPVIYPLGVWSFGSYLIRFLRRANAIATPTATAARLLTAIGLARPIEVISNGVDTERFRPAADKRAARARLGLPDRPILLYTGRLDAEKDMPTLIRAAARAFAQRDGTDGGDAQLVIGGEGTERPRLERLVAELGLAGRTTFPGYLPAADLPLLYQSADVYCMASAVELQSITTLEALACGLPVVAANAGALPELVHHGENGLLAAPGDVDAFASAMAAILSRPERAAAMGRQGRARAETHSLGVVAHRHVGLLERTAQGSAARAGTA